MSLEVRPEDDGHIRIRFAASFEGLKPIFGVALAVGVGFALFALSGRAPRWSTIVGFFPATFLWIALRRLKRTQGAPVEFVLAPADRKLTGPSGDYTFAHVGHLVLDSYTRRGSRGGGQGRSVFTIYRLSFLPQEPSEEALAALSAEVDARPKTQALGAPPKPPRDADVLMARGPYSLGRALARELGHALDLPLMDLTSSPPRIFEPEDQQGALEALRGAHASLSSPSEPPRGVGRRDRQGETCLRHAATPASLRFTGAALFLGASLVFYVCSGGALYIAFWPLLLALLVVGGSTRWKITPEGVETSSRWFGIPLGPARFFGYDELRDVSATEDKRGVCVRLVTEDATHRVAAPRVEMAEYLAACALHPPERSAPHPGPYR
ncbi:MAG: hypothetical protein GXP55_07385 [Deltaproteobacteria bacterium]|nr:hypothetical protein [Deltaproteobacteria bacterium]